MDYYFYDENDESVSTTDLLGLREIGGVGQVAYPVIQFQNYDLDYENDVLVAYPVVSSKGDNYKFYGNISGKMLLTELCNLAKNIDDPDNQTPYTEQILQWCQKYVHPYAVDSLVTLGKDEQFDRENFAFLAKREGTFSIQRFMNDLGKLYFAVRFYRAIDEVCMGNDDHVPSLCIGGRFFEDIPYFERYRYDPDQRSVVDYSSANGDLIEEMKLDAAVPTMFSPDEFVRTPYDDYDFLREKLVELIPTFNMKPRLHPSRKRYMFAAEVESVFDICWYTFARMVVDDAPPEQKISTKMNYSGTVYTCLNCGRYFYRKRAEQLYCMRPDCQHARKAKNQRDFRSRTIMKKANEK